MRITIDRRGEDLRGHPDRAENERAGFSRFQGVREHYDIAPGGVLIGSGRIARWYAPMAHPELPQFVAKLAQTDDRGVLAFAETYGQLGFTSLTSDITAAFYTWPDGRKTSGGDPLDWMRAHARTVQLCLELTEALQKNSTSDIDRFTQYRPPEDGRPTYAILHVAELSEAESEIHVELNQPAFERARSLRADVINPNIEHVHRALTIAGDAADQLFWRYRATIEAVYWHLANAAEGGIVGRCKRPGCGARFIQRHRSQEYCAPRWGQQESPCAIWVRQMKHTNKLALETGDVGLQRIATDSKTARSKAPQVGSATTKKARQSRGRKRRA